jgi:hypothetical protein
LKETNYYELICGCIKVQGKCGRERNKFYLWGSEKSFWRKLELN